MTANAYIALERLSLFEEMLRASGWMARKFGDESCYFPPEHLRSVSQREYGAGHLHVWDALSLQTRADLTTIAALSNSERTDG